MQEIKAKEDVFTTASRCAECKEALCLKACPEHVDLRALFEFVAAHGPRAATWRTRESEAESFAGDAIESSFTPWFQ